MLLPLCCRAYEWADIQWTTNHDVLASEMTYIRARVNPKKEVRNAEFLTSSAKFRRFVLFRTESGKSSANGLEFDWKMAEFDRKCPEFSERSWTWPNWSCGEGGTVGECTFLLVILKFTPKFGKLWLFGKVGGWIYTFFSSNFVFWFIVCAGWWQIDALMLMNDRVDVIEVFMTLYFCVDGLMCWSCWCVADCADTWPHPRTHALAHTFWIKMYDNQNSATRSVSKLSY